MITIKIEQQIPAWLLLAVTDIADKHQDLTNICPELQRAVAGEYVVYKGDNHVAIMPPHKRNPKYRLLMLTDGMEL